MYCTHCGKQINDEAVVCPNCGVPTGNTGFDKANTGYQQPSGYQQPTGGYQQPNNYYQPKGYMQGNQPAPQPVIRNVCGIIGFVFGLASLYFGLYMCITCIIALVLSIVGMVNRKKCNSCNGLTIAGLVLSIISFVIWGIVWLIFGSMIFFELIYSGYYFL